MFRQFAKLSRARIVLAAVVASLIVGVGVFGASTASPTHDSSALRAGTVQLNGGDDWPW